MFGKNRRKTPSSDLPLSSPATTLSLPVIPRTPLPFSLPYPPPPPSSPTSPPSSIPLFPKIPLLQTRRRPHRRCNQLASSYTSAAAELPRRRQKSNVSDVSNANALRVGSHVLPKAETISRLRSTPNNNSSEFLYLGSIATSRGGAIGGRDGDVSLMITLSHLIYIHAHVLIRVQEDWAFGGEGGSPVSRAMTLELVAVNDLFISTDCMYMVTSTHSISLMLPG
ncbi:hypothetical protein RHMOL_Rhmol02G0154700 [Rhododendron molle]|uniref:Uncharacterized protein n=1 Tax=Rhododendron molle TaxID=49168 RepID=A0ACC0PTI9_RHOML|nr:hypothetical protein RHMOL_Rhmol02G0154700 [Rhododendron molle]